MSDFVASYLKLSKARLEQIKQELFDCLKSCELCPRLCRVNRLDGKSGFCRTGVLAKVSSFNLHFGEEPELVGGRGSGTIFFSFCNLGCVYCQNYTISHLGEGQPVTAEELAGMILKLKEAGAYNINFVTPTHVLPQIVEALIIARERGLCLPLVYNSGGYDSWEVLKKAEGIFDIYMPDAKYCDEKNSGEYSSAKDYWPVLKAALREMHRQVGNLVIEQGIAQRGLLIRHLVLPQETAGSFRIIDFITDKISRDTYLNIMDQYRPCFKASSCQEISRRITAEEYKAVLDYACKKGLSRGFKTGG